MSLSKTVIDEVFRERLRQIGRWGLAHDNDHCHGELARHASVLALYAGLSELDRDNARQFGPHHNGANLIWPWDEVEFKLGDIRCDLVKAAALLIAEIERIDRAGVTAK